MNELTPYTDCFMVLFSARCHHLAELSELFFNTLKSGQVYQVLYKSVNDIRSLVFDIYSISQLAKSAFR